MVHELKSPSVDFVFTGPPEKRPLPAYFYFALSQEESLNLSPYNHGALPLLDAPLRVFSCTIPGHEEGRNKFHAMQYWSDEIASDNDILTPFFERVTSGIEWLVKAGWVDPAHIAVGGLSRGAFVATHIAARLKTIKTLLGYAPLTSLYELDEFKNQREGALEPWKLNRLVHELLHLEHVRFYMGNRDTKVNSDAIYGFIRELTEEAHTHKARNCHIELFITPSIGHKGHGTAPHLFEEGALWVKQQLLK